MIAHSDNTATDMALKRVGADNVRAFIASIGLLNSRIPDSTRQFFGYVAGSPNWQHLTWLELLDALVHQPPTGPPLINDVVTFVSTANDFVSFYSRALQGQFFQQEASLRTFRHILTMEVGSEVFPLGLTGFSKGGAFEFRQEQALSLAGGVFIPQQLGERRRREPGGREGRLPPDPAQHLQRAPGRVLHLTGLRGGGPFRLMFQ